MNKWLSRTAGGLATATLLAYVSFGDPLFDMWVAAQKFESQWYVSTANEVDDEINDNDENASAQKPNTRLIQKYGPGRFGHDQREIGNRGHQRSHYLNLRAFQESVGDHWKSTVQVFEKSRQVALGAVVGADGWIVTKASEVPDKNIEVRLHDGSKAEALVKMRRQDLDLALLKIERDNLSPIQWDTAVDVPVGGWLASTDSRRIPLSIGVMSVAKRNVRRERPVLGVKLAEPPEGEKGAMVETVVEGSGADRGGIRSGDVIEKINNESLKTLDEVFKRLGNLNAGQTIEIGLIRDGENVSLSAQMMDIGLTLQDPTEMEVNGEISARSTGFQNIFQHDTVLAPNQCGGPIVDVNGNAVGLNIARAGRVSSYALPARIVGPAIDDMLASVKGIPAAGGNITKASVQTTRNTTDLPPSVPGGITVESAKPEVVLPDALRRR